MRRGALRASRRALRASRIASRVAAPAAGDALRAARRDAPRYARAAADGYLRARPRTVAATAAGAGLLLALVSILASGPYTASGQRASERALAAHPELMDPHDHAPIPEEPAWHPAGQVLAPVSDDTGAPTPTPAGLTASLGPLLAAAGTGKITAAVLDPASGRLLYSSGSATPLTPASTNKLATAAAALSVLGPDHRFTTRTGYDPAGGTVTLVGGGDPSLRSADLAKLVDSTAAALKARNATRVRLGYDISLFAQPALHPIGHNDNIALVQALTVDEGRTDPNATEASTRYPDPAAQAAASFAALLRARGITVDGAPAQSGEPGASVPLAENRSAPLSDLVEHMLTESDNDYAEQLGHQVAVAEHLPATFEGAAKAVRQVLAGRLGIDLGTTRLHDSSGLDSADAIPAGVLARILAVAESTAHPELRSLISGLPVAGFTGTLDDRSDTASAGLVHAKTGSLTGVDTLAGTVVDRDGRLLVFAFMANGDSAFGSGRSSLDALAGRVAACGCR
ncbi:D-alanyl-D-alanine carboxypeptidase/D-alanyl-D-alanine endopeptidase [Phaeacidiphilus oryzae]|uniref:D-alanyl-D-alanine carboxypeptidase/D-alanyl-D-alanine endopeptidase n=1 Tax=Phaeacidiphilus oryzae TaxID=348818 RepID=UPI00056A9F9D|nr:D-alanyl-D-alanine carboxypeptidase/D-alanyl-D-alanine-endopeptidase [Phaeacidiphilus oryzae]